MDYNALLDVATWLGYELAMSGAETFRIEESVSRIMSAYGVNVEVFAIPNCLHVSIDTKDREALTRMRRIGFHGNDLDAVEKYSNLSRRICRERPEPEIAKSWLKETKKSLRHYSLPIHLLGNILGACGFAIIFGGTFVDCLWAGACGLSVGLVSSLMEKLKANNFFRIIAASFIMALIAYFAGSLGFTDNADTVIIGTLMILVPGLVFTNAMRDIIYGDTNSGINRIVQVFLVAAAIALGTGAAWNIVDKLITIPIVDAICTHSLLVEAVACFVGCTGFFILFNIHGPGGFLCALGGMLTWVCYRLICQFGGSDLAAYFFATMFAALYSESMARIRKYPAISYLVISVFPLIPGAGIYYTTNHLVRQDMTSFTEKGMHTIAIAGAMAVGILLISTVFRVISIYTQQKQTQNK
ncbi:MAG: threonine/serine exporter family protein [Oscillospiraceae bacterium]|nr:threonine/serine exporter family protein [Oscillospiraceae bacterium]